MGYLVPALRGLANGLVAVAFWTAVFVALLSLNLLVLPRLIAALEPAWPLWRPLMGLIFAAAEIGFLLLGLSRTAR